MSMPSTVTPSSSTMFLRRSWVIGRCVTTPWRAKAMAVASTAPIQIGRKRPPSRSNQPIVLLKERDGLIGGQLDPDSDERNLDHLHRLRLRPPEGLPPNNIRLVYSRGMRVDVARQRI